MFNSVRRAVARRIPERIRQVVWRRRAARRIRSTNERPLETQGPRRYQRVLVDRPLRRLHTGAFDEAQERHVKHDSWLFFDADITRLSNYFLCMQVEEALDATEDGDLLLAGVSFGTSAKVVADVLDIAATGRSWWLVDPFDGSGNPRYNQDLEQARAGWDERIPTRWVTGRIPAALETVDAKLAFIHFATGKYSAERPSLDLLLPRLVPGGRMMLDIYGTLDGKRQAELDDLLAAAGLTSWELPTGQLVVRRPT